MTDRESDVVLRAKLRVGTVLRGKYHLDRLLGVGGMAVVYKATHRNQAEFAVKMLHPELSIREDVRVRFLREGYAANSVKHPGAVLVVDDDVAEDGTAFLVMELLEGAEVENLSQRGGGRMAPLVASAIIVQLLDVLEAAHAKGIVHRDIKPANLFVTRDGTLKVLDFGIARARDAAVSGAHATGSGMLLGTPAFMPPEQALAQSNLIDGQTDVWAAGATLFSLCTGHYVHEGDNAAQLMVRAATTPARPLASVAPEVPAAIAQVVDRALAFEKAARWPSAGAMRDALDAACRASFGRGASKAIVAAALESQQAGVASTQHPPAPSADAPAPSGASASARGAPALTAPRPLVPAGVGTTAQPIQTSAVASIPGVRKTSWGMVAAAVAGVALLLGVGVYAMRGGGAPVTPGAASGIVVSSTGVPSVTTAAPAPTTPPATSAAPSAIVSPHASSGSTQPSKHALPTPPGTKPGARPTAAPSASAETAQAPTPAPAPQPPPPPKPPSAGTQNPLDLPIK